jgi:hypothetical protein
VGAQGTAVIDFGAFPGKSDASVDVTGQTGIIAGSLVEAWIRPVATAINDVDNHIFAPLRIVAANIVPGVGFTIYGWCDEQINEPVIPEQPDYQIRNTGAAAYATVAFASESRGVTGGKAMLLWGTYNVNWAWN